MDAAAAYDIRFDTEHSSPVKIGKDFKETTINVYSADPGTRIIKLFV